MFVLVHAGQGPMAGPVSMQVRWLAAAGTAGVCLSLATPARDHTWRLPSYRAHLGFVKLSCPRYRTLLGGNL